MSEVEAAKPKVFRSRGKGKVGEREVAKMLEAWWCTLVEPCKFKSTPQSGGFGGAQAADVRGDFKIAGDLMTTAKQWLFCVEVKRREQGVLKRLYQMKPSPVWGWWRQCVKAALEEGRVPLLFFRRNKDEWIVMMPRVQFGHLVPRLDPWAFDQDARLIDTGGVDPMMTMWEVLRDVPDIKVIMKACSAYVSQTTKPISSTPSQRLLTSPKPRRAKVLWSSDEKAQKRIEERARLADGSSPDTSPPTRPTARRRTSPTGSAATGSSAAAPSSAPPAGRRAAARSPRA